MPKDGGDSGRVRSTGSWSWTFEISDTLNKARQQLLENFDDEVREKLRMRNESSRASLGRYEQRLIALTRFELGDNATFTSDSSFELRASPFDGEIPLGTTNSLGAPAKAHFYRLTHPLAEAVIARAKSRGLTDGDEELRFDYSGHAGKISIVESFWAGEVCCAWTA